ncbi:MAG: hypothetical protein PHU54_09740 [Candidatus Omnitrophica bacterium]|nr:hypothetical protein [Candidatus Omnitrophota bacterium]
MKVSFMWLLEAKAILSRGIFGADPYTGEKVEPAKNLPASMFRHLRRVIKAVNDELEIGAPEHKEFIAKWAVEGKFPEPDTENYAEFEPAYQEFFLTPDFIIEFSPFKLELLDNLNEKVPVDLMNLMDGMNEAYEQSQKVAHEDNPSTGDTDKAAIKPQADA